MCLRGRSGAATGPENGKKIKSARLGQTQASPTPIQDWPEADAKDRA